MDSVPQVHKPIRTQVVITDPADADEYLDDVYGTTLRLRRAPTAATEGGPLLRHSRTTMGPFAIDDLYAAGHLEAAPDPLHKVVVVSVISGQVAGSCDGMAGRAAAGEVTLLSQPHLPHRIWSRDVRASLVVLDPSLVTGGAGLPAAHGRPAVRFDSFTPADAATARAWTQTVSYVKDVVLGDGALATPLMLGNAGRLLAAAALATFCTAPASDTRPQDRTDHQPVLLRRAMEYMEANVDRDIGVTDIAEAVHVTPRAVQYMFRRHLELTPLQYLRRLRLHYAHQELLAADRMKTSVSQVATRWGFAHTGRFAVLYREAYGRSPHATLRG